MELVKDNETVKKPAKAVYDPNKQYTWDPAAVFTLNGHEFGAVLNTVRAILATPDAQVVLWADKANDYIEDIFKRSVENGVAYEMNTNAKK